MESYGIPGHINISESTKLILEECCYDNLTVEFNKIVGKNPEVKSYIAFGNF